MRTCVLTPELLLAAAAGIGAGFYLGYSWLPSFFTKHAGIPQPLTLWMVLSGMVIFTFVVPVSVILFFVMLYFILLSVGVVANTDACLV
jgi:hypothetical protein